MSKSTGIVITAASIAGVNDWIQSHQIPWRIAVAGLLTALLFDGIEKVSSKAAVTLSVAMLITVLVTPFHGNSPAQELAQLVNQPQRPITTKKSVKA